MRNASEGWEGNPVSFISLLFLLLLLTNPDKDHSELIPFIVSSVLCLDIDAMRGCPSEFWRYRWTALGY
jgi:hypothetical protein